MTPNCAECGGACCEMIAVDGLVPLKEEYRSWFEARGILTIAALGIVEHRCPKLVGGRCSIYEDRPSVCREFEVGSPECLLSIRLLRPGIVFTKPLL